jgi:hypothetical protein
MLLDQVIARLGEQVPVLGLRIHGAGEYRRLLQSNALRAAAQGAYVMPAGVVGGRVSSSTGAYLQAISHVIAVVIFVPDPNPAAGRQTAAIDALIHDVIQAICGWEPPDSIGQFELLRGAMINLGDAALAFQLEFSLSDQLRIST